MTHSQGKDEACLSFRNRPSRPRQAKRPRLTLRDLLHDTSLTRKNRQSCSLSKFFDLPSRFDRPLCLPAPFLTPLPVFSGRRRKRFFCPHTCKFFAPSHPQSLARPFPVPTTCLVTPGACARARFWVSAGRSRRLSRAWARVRGCGWCSGGWFCVVGGGWLVLLLAVVLVLGSFLSWVRLVVGRLGCPLLGGGWPGRWSRAGEGRRLGVRC